MRFIFKNKQVEYSAVTCRKLTDELHQHLLRNSVHCCGIRFFVCLRRVIQSSRLAHHIVLRKYCNTVFTITRSIQARKDPSPRQVNLSKESKSFRNRRASNPAQSPGHRHNANIRRASALHIAHTVLCGQDCRLAYTVLPIPVLPFSLPTRVYLINTMRTKILHPTEKKITLCFL